MSAHVSLERKGAIQILRLNRPEKKNALTAAMYAALGEGLQSANKSEAITVTVILGQPGIFCAGNDVADFLAVSQAGGELHANAFLYALADNEKPLIAAIDGPAVGIGTTLTFHCDLVFATERALFQTPFVNLGIVPEAASSLLAPRSIGYVRAFELLVMGETFPAARAKEAGFVSRIVAPEELESAALQAAETLASKPKEALRISRSLLRGDPASIKERMREEGALFSETVKSEEARAAFAAFLQKRKDEGKE